MSEPTATPFEHYRAMKQRRGGDELRTLAHIKRFMECLTGDPGFRDALVESPDNAADVVAGRGIDIDPHELAPFWHGGFRVGLANEELENYPLALLWKRWIADLIQFRDLMRVHGAAAGGDRTFRAWRLRRVAQADSELGDARHTVVHAVVSFELCSGCSVGCWFCGLKADKLEDVFPYSEANARLWREVLQVTRDKLGMATQTGFCYWATDPYDNPDYLDFINDYHDVIGVLPQTTTAVPFKDLDWTRRLVDTYRDRPGVPARFSILSTKILRTVHDNFTPEELLAVELVQQQPGSVVVKSRAGRILDRDKPLPDPAGNATDVAHDMGTIACVSGFLVNMVEKSVKLISPCRASEEWPLGYRVFLERRFSNATDYAEALDEAFTTRMIEHLPAHALLSFRPDLAHDRTEAGFTVSTPFKRHRFAGAPFLPELGDLVARGDLTMSDVVERIVEEGGDLFGVTGAIESLFKAGLLDESTYAPGTVRARQVATGPHV